MKKSMLIAALVAVMGVASAQAEGVPSQSKLNSLGLSSMNVASDAAGEEVRGQGFGATTLTVTLITNITDAGTGQTANNTVGGTQSSVFGQDPQTLDAVSFGGSGFGGFTSSSTPSFATFVSTPLTVNSAIGGVTSVASIQGFSWGAGK